MLTPPGFPVMSPLPYLSNKLIIYLSTLLRSQNTINITHQFGIWKPEFYNRTAQSKNTQNLLFICCLKRRLAGSGRYEECYER